MRWQLAREDSLLADMDRVVAEDHLPFAAVSRPIPVSSIASLQPVSSTDKISLRIECDSGLLISDNDDQLVQSLPLAVDFHSCSLFLERSPGRQDTVYLQTARPLKPGDPLHLWFSTDLQALLGISFLSPLNIRGEKNYVCHFCEESFENPNPLKIHLALDCDKLKPSHLWRRLKDAIDVTNNNLLKASLPYDSILKLSLEPTAKGKGLSNKKDSPPSPAHSSYSSPSPNRERLEETRPSSEPPRNSAFRPYLSLRDAMCHNSSNHNFSSSDSVTVREDNQNLRSNLNREVYLQHQAAEIETLVSNLGQSKQGHLCLYCGKIYSRKYGLKIHIRTHTGFKPLKCKYCLRPFGDPSNLNKHVRLHSESETPYRCEMCGKMLVRRRDLERHMKSRHKLSNLSY